MDGGDARGMTVADAAPPAVRTAFAVPHLALLAVVSLGLNLFAITWGLPNVHDWTNMSLAPIQPLEFVKRLLYREVWLFHYPPLHFIVLALVFGPYVLYLRATGGLGTPSDTYPFGLTDPEASLTMLILLARLTSAAMGTGLVLVNYLTVRRFYDARAALVSSLLIASAYPIIHYSHNAMVDVPHLFWLSLALYSFVRLLERFETKWYLLLALFTAFAVGTKHSALALALGLIPSLLYFHYRHAAARDPDRSPLAAFLDRRLVYGALLFGVTLIVIFNPILNWAGFVAHVTRHRRVSAGGSVILETAPSWLGGHLELIGAYIEYIRQSNGLVVFVLIVAGVVYCAVRYPKQALIVGLPIVTYYVLYLKNFGTHHLRYILPVYVLCTWQAAKLASDAWTTRRLPRPLPQLLVAVVLGSSFLYGFTVHYLYVKDPRYAAEQWIAQHIAPGARLLALEPRYALPRIPDHIDVTYRKIWDYHGDVLADITDVQADYVVVSVNEARRSRAQKWRVSRIKNIDAGRFLRERGYERVIDFKTPLPVWAADVPDIHVINPRITIWKSADRPDRASAAAPGTGSN